MRRMNAKCSPAAYHCYLGYLTAVAAAATLPARTGRTCLPSYPSCQFDPRRRSIDLPSRTCGSITSGTRILVIIDPNVAQGQEVISATSSCTIAQLVLIILPGTVFHQPASQKTFLCRKC